MDEVQHLLAEALARLGFSGDPEMERTPERVAELLRSFVPDADPPEVSTFASPGEGPVVLRDVPFHSLCAHHLLPFFGTASVVYRPAERVAGFGSLARVVRHYAQRPQLQERMAEQIADRLVTALAPRGLAVRLVARQLCMEMRGVLSGGEAEVLAVRGDAGDLLELVRG